MTIPSRRFTAVPSDPEFNVSLLDQLNAYAAHGFYHSVTLNDSLYGGLSGGYTSDPTTAAVRYAPSLPCPATGRWSVVETFLCKSSDMDQASVGPYVKVEPSLRVGETSRVLGTFSQRVNKIRAGVKFPLTLASAVLVPSDGVLEAKVSVYGFPPDSVNDLVVWFRVVNVGG